MFESKWSVRVKYKITWKAFKITLIAVLNETIIVQFIFFVRVQSVLNTSICCDLCLKVKGERMFRAKNYLGIFYITS